MNSTSKCCLIPWIWKSNFCTTYLNILHKWICLATDFLNSAITKLLIDILHCRKSFCNKYQSKCTILLISLFSKQYSFRSSPIPFECPETILSTPLSSTMPHTVRMESSSRVLTPIPFQSRVSTPYPMIDSVSTAKGNLCLFIK